MMNQITVPLNGQEMKQPFYYPLETILSAAAVVVHLAIETVPSDVDVDKKIQDARN